MVLANLLITAGRFETNAYLLEHQPVFIYCSLLQALTIMFILSVTLRYVCFTYRLNKTVIRKNITRMITLEVGGVRNCQTTDASLMKSDLRGSKTRTSWDT